VQRVRGEGRAKGFKGAGLGRALRVALGVPGEGLQAASVDRRLKIKGRRR
jgi:hypothetical protein